MDIVYSIHHVVIELMVSTGVSWAITNILHVRLYQNRKSNLPHEIVHAIISGILATHTQTNHTGLYI